MGCRIASRKPETKSGRLAGGRARTVVSIALCLFCGACQANASGIQDLYRPIERASIGCDDPSVDELGILVSQCLALDDLACAFESHTLRCQKAIALGDAQLIADWESTYVASAAEAVTYGFTDRALEARVLELVTWLAVSGPEAEVARIARVLSLARQIGRTDVEAYLLYYCWLQSSGTSRESFKGDLEAAALREPTLESELGWILFEHERALQEYYRGEYDTAWDRLSAARSALAEGFPDLPLDAARQDVHLLLIGMRRESPSPAQWRDASEALQVLSDCPGAFYWDSLRQVVQSCHDSGNIEEGAYYAGRLLDEYPDPVGLAAGELKTPAEAAALRAELGESDLARISDQLGGFYSAYWLFDAALDLERAAEAADRIIRLKSLVDDGGLPLWLARRASLYSLQGATAPADSVARVGLAKLQFVPAGELYREGALVLGTFFLASPESKSDTRLIRDLVRVLASALAMSDASPGAESFDRALAVRYMDGLTALGRPSEEVLRVYDQHSAGIAAEILDHDSYLWSVYFNLFSAGRVSEAIALADAHLRAVLETESDAIVAYINPYTSIIADFTRFAKADQPASEIEMVLQAVRDWGTALRHRSRDSAYRALVEAGIWSDETRFQAWLDTRRLLNDDASREVLAARSGKARARALELLRALEAGHWGDDADGAAFASFVRAQLLIVSTDCLANEALAGGDVTTLSEAVREVEPFQWKYGQSANIDSAFLQLVGGDVGLVDQELYAKYWDRFLEYEPTDLVLGGRLTHSQRVIMGFVPEPDLVGFLEGSLRACRRSQEIPGRTD